MQNGFLARRARLRTWLGSDPAISRVTRTTSPATMGLFLALILTGCTPYPIYTHEPTEAGGAPKAGTGTATTPQGRSTSEPARDRTDKRQLRDRPGVDAAIFTHVVDRYAGMPYKRGGDDEEGIDCSHLVKAIYQEYSGTRLPASTRALYQLPEEVTREELVVGDLVFFSFDDVTISHVGIYMGGARFIHASESRGVIMSSLSELEFRDAYKGARRVL